MTESLRVIVAGGGTVGLRTAELLDDRGHDVVLIERDPDRSERVAAEYVASIIEGDAARPAVLRQAQPDRCDAIAAVTDDEATNFAVCMAAQRMADLHTVMRIDGDPDELYPQYVDGVVSTASLTARATVNEVVGGGVRSIEEVGGRVEILEVEIAEDAPAAGKSLAEIRLPQGSLIIVDADGDRIGGPETVLEPGERFLVAVEEAVTDEVMNLLRG
ncbi:potassium channel family protein [Haloarcula nitratireducens]|uniref:TrkA family potassium uptake protein n=1 Tax=Haloarcula nitratireducens TaxID=2487749 RepID=A0AAW4PD50_9EURY|nr:TrkA family potassium uptake protein [Halomicroarcula nitratireducens]MBX0295815.1 TrkA family potassium uptake protein [Halomicroarcula nitratireducens]